MSEDLELPPWCDLLAPLPIGFVPTRESMVGPDTSGDPSGDAIAGWTQLTLYLRAGTHATRIVIVVVDPDNAVISASDGIYRRFAAADEVSPVGSTSRFLFDTIGGRFEHDGEFRGTRCRLVVAAPGGNDEAPQQIPAPAVNAEEILALRALAGELLERSSAHRPPRPAR